MKKILFLLLAVAAFPLFAAGLGDDEVRQAVYGALDQARAALKTAPFGQKTVAILPFPGDRDGLFTGKLKNQLTSLGFICVEGKEDPMWNEIVKEIAWDERKDDILDPATLVKFGKLKAAQILLYGKVVDIDKNDDRVYVEIELHATDIATKQHIWGGTFAARIYKSKDMQGIISLDGELRALLKKSFAAAKESLLSPEYAGKLGEVRNVTVIPLAGDIDEYMTGIAIEMLTTTRHLPKRPQIPSLSQLRAVAKAESASGDVVFYGAVRDLRKTSPTKKAVDRKTMRETYTVNADIQLFIEDLKTGTILWSKTITLSDKVSEDRAMTAEERAAARKESREELGGSLADALIDNWGKILGGIIGIAVLIFVGLFIKAYLTNRMVR